MVGVPMPLPPIPTPPVLPPNNQWIAPAQQHHLVHSFEYKCHIGECRSTRFQEDIWFGNAPLASQLWYLYCLVNDRNKIASGLWDGEQFKCSSRSTFSPDLNEKCSILSPQLGLWCKKDQEDSLICQFGSKGIYLSKSLYAIVNLRRVQAIFFLCLELKIPPKIQSFLWLLPQNKVMTCDNLRRRGIAKPLECRHCTEIELVYHLFFECRVSRIVWQDVKLIFYVNIVDFFYDLLLPGCAHQIQLS